MAITRITINRGDTYNFNVTVTENSVPVSLVGAAVFFTVKKAVDGDVTDAEAVIKKKVTSHTDPANGETKIALTAEDTTLTPGDYRYDIQIKDSNGNIVSTKYSLFRILPDVTRRVT